MSISAQPSVTTPFPVQHRARYGAGAVRLELFDAFGAAEQLWRQLAQVQPLVTPYQRFEWIVHWFNHVGRRAGADPLVIAGLDLDGSPLFILPLIRELRRGTTIARFCGGAHANLNMALWRRDFATSLTAPQALGVLRDTARARNIDLFVLLGQPPVWRGMVNPFALLPHQPAPDDVHTGVLVPAGPPFELRLPSGMRKKARKLQKLHGFRYFTARTVDDVDRILSAFWPQKAARFARHGIHNVFADASVRDFIDAACRDGLADRRPTIELHALEGANEMLAIVGGVASEDHFSVMFNSITDTDRARMSPGIILMAEIITGCGKRGLTSYDLGAGDAPYKKYFCSDSAERFDSFIPFSARGRLLAVALQASDAMLRTLKTTPALMSALQAMRRWTTGAARRSE